MALGCCFCSFAFSAPNLDTSFVSGWNPVNHFGHLSEVLLVPTPDPGL